MTVPAVTYSRVAKILHWLIALGIVTLLLVGWSFEFIPKGTFKFKLIQLHKSVGITILLLSFIRLAWRFTHRPPALPSHMTKGERLAAEVVHVLLYVMMIGMPLAGWAMVSTSSLGLPTILYGLIEWPHIPGLQQSPNREMFNNLAWEMHANGAILLGVLFFLHVGGALKHHFIDKDDVLLRMAPSFMGRLLLVLRGGS